MGRELGSTPFLVMEVDAPRCVQLNGVFQMYTNFEISRFSDNTGTMTQ